MTGVILSPRVTLRALADHPRSIDVLCVSFVVALVSTAAFLETETGRVALIDQWERTAVAFGQELTDAQYAALVEASRSGAAYAALSSLAGGPVLALGMSALLFIAFSAFGGRRASYGHVLAIVAHAGVVLAVRQLVAAPVSYARETLASPTSLNVLVPMFDEASPLARFFGAIDLFVLWWLAMIAIGLSILYDRPVRTLLVVLVGGYIALAAALAGVMAVTGGIA